MRCYPFILVILEVLSKCPLKRKGKKNALEMGVSGILIDWKRNQRKLEEETQTLSIIVYCGCYIKFRELDNFT